jgi:hypothetical protein
MKHSGRILFSRARVPPAAEPAPRQLIELVIQEAMKRSGIIRENEEILTRGARLAQYANAFGTTGGSVSYFGGVSR